MEVYTIVMMTSKMIITLLFSWCSLSKLSTFLDLTIKIYRFNEIDWR